MAASGATANQSKSFFNPTAIVIVALLVIGGGAFWYLEKTADQREPGPVLTAEAKAYVKNLKLSEVEMKAKENTLKQAVVEITGRIANAGDRPVRLVELTCVFYDPYGQLVLRERVPIVKSPLEPGETRNFRLPFDTIPESWNQGMPQLVIAQIQF
jgi:hypothetical protein